MMLARSTLTAAFLLLLPFLASAQEADPAPAETAPEPSAESTTPKLAFDPATIGLPELPQPMRSAEDFQQTLGLIDTRLAELEADFAQVEQGQGAGIEQRLDLLRQLRVTVQRRATLEERLTRLGEEVAQQRAQLEKIEAEGVVLEPPFLVSQLDQYQAELGLKQAMEEVAETRLETALRRLANVEKALNTAVRARRAARDQLNEAEAEALPERERAPLVTALQLARLQELLARQELAAAESAVKLARYEDDLAEVQQQLLAAWLAFLDTRAELPAEMLEQRLAELAAAETGMRERTEALQRQGDQAESALYQARRRLAEAPEETDTSALDAWVTARQTELDAARSGVDSLTAARGDLARMRQRWQQRFDWMQAPEAAAGEAAEHLRDIITAAATARAEKDDIESRLNALRTIQLAHSRRLRDPALSDAVRKALLVRGAAQELAERHGRELLETKDALIALLEGMRRQLEVQVENQTLSLQMLHAQEALVSWWDAELIVIEDQSIRARELVTALTMFVLVLILVSLIRLGARRALRRRKAKPSAMAESGDLRLALSAIAGNTSQLFVLIAAFYVAMVFSGLGGPTVRDWLGTALVIAFYAQLGLWANAAIADYFTRKRTRQEMRDPSMVTGYGVLMVFVRVGIWITVIVSLLAYFKYPIAGLLGALGVGSIAVGFALQNILGDVFSSMAIILDKPFRVGDFVKAGDTVGTIELIGIKTTRIRSLSGEQVVLSNSDLLTSRIHNYKQFRERRIAFSIGVVYQTPREQLEQIPQLLREAIEEQPRTRFDRAHFAAFGDFSLNFEIVYYVLSPDYALYMDVQQGINLGIHRRFEQAGVEFAYPTQELIVRRARPARPGADAP